MNGKTLRALRRTAFVSMMLVIAPAFAGNDPIEAFRPAGEATHDHAAFDALLDRFVVMDDEGLTRVDYGGLASEHDVLRSYVAELEAATPSNMSPDAAHAYWLNLYNAKTLDVVLDAYPVESIRRINLGGALFKPGPWSKEILRVEGQDLTLDDVEHRIVRAIFNDPMSHYGLNCASFSCPNLMPDAYTAENLNEQLAESGRLYVNHDRGVQVRDGRIVASKIFDWYAGDFGGEDALKSHWTALASPQKAAEIEAAEISYYRYDWDLNDIQKPSGT